MRELILLARKGVTSWKLINFKDLPSSGRMDLIARCISSAIFISEAVRKNVIFHVILQGKPNPPILISIYSWKLRRFYPDERNIASHIKIALRKFEENEFREVESEPGVFVCKKSFQELVKEIIRERKFLIYLHPKGKPIENFRLDDNFVAILGDHKGLDKKSELLIKRLKIPFVSLNKRIIYLTSQVISVLHYLADQELTFSSKD
ncbi:MAG: tRNA (pseudouridine(54)-N(1))-methyltransferase TrmY [Candidatus Aenigmarchaeota archaeon]|nr:tRNA (pseudouridine(54)-N(1))-methyltransferase TrmY [Candidatus Aenigmarchaeota archaeon]